MGAVCVFRTFSHVTVNRYIVFFRPDFGTQAFPHDFETRSNVLDDDISISCISHYRVDDNDQPVAAAERKHHNQYLHLRMQSAEGM